MGTEQLIKQLRKSADGIKDDLPGFALLLNLAAMHLEHQEDKISRLEQELLDLSAGVKP